MRKITGQRGLVCVAILVSIGAALKERLSLNRAMEEMASLRETILHLDTYKKALITHLNGKEIRSPFLEGRIVGGPGPQGPLTVEPNHGVVYYLSPDCPISSTNYGLLNELADAGVPVFGLVFDSAERAVERHASQWEVGFPILLNPGGSAVDVLPRYGTPTVVVVSQGEVVFLGFGELGSEQEDSVRSAVRGRVSAMTPGE